MEYGEIESSDNNQKVFFFNYFFIYAFGYQKNGTFSVFSFAFFSFLLFWIPIPFAYKYGVLIDYFYFYFQNTCINYFYSLSGIPSWLERETRH